MSGFNQRMTTLDINGPVLAWLTQPEDVATCGVATFIGIATANFPTQTPTNIADPTGSMAYKWHYKVGSATTVGELYDGDIAGLGLTSVSGTGSTTLTVYGTYTGADLTVENLKFFLRPDYTPSAYGTDDPITAGTARSTGNANNELQIDSNIVVCTQYPGIVITTQPTTQTIPATTQASATGTATFNVVGITTGNTAEGLTYQWTANGGDLSNGETSYNVTVPVDPVNVTVDGFGGEGIYLDTTAWTGTRTVTFSTQEESGVFHYINIEDINNFPENYGSKNLDVLGGKIYKCTAPNGALHIGGDTPAGGGNTRLVVEEGGDDWNDMILNISGQPAYFRTLSSAPVISEGPSEEVRTLTDRVTGAQTSTLTMSTATAGIQTVNCRISHPTACNSPLYSDTVNLNVISSRQIINWELLTGEPSAAWYGSGSQNIFDSSKRFEASAAVMSRVLCVYAPEKDIVAKVTLAAGAGRSSGPSRGGEGGVSQFYVTLKQNVEYVVKLGSSVQPSGGNGGGGGGSFFYKGGTVLAVCGGGGGAGSGHRGGAGGGIGIGGANGNGSRGGRGGTRYADGQLPLQGFFAGGGWLPPIDRSSGSPGRLSACTFGQYWTGQGYSACADIGYVKWRSSNGSETSQSTSNILRGFKSGLGHRNDGGNTSWSTGGGGAGAAGGAGSTAASDGGGGGSGYNNGDVEIITTQLGGNTSQDGYVIFEV